MPVVVASQLLDFVAEVGNRQQATGTIGRVFKEKGTKNDFIFTFARGLL
ncbi:MAG: hypothetical protein SXA11_15020 [Cyanobacteriota bacterium]|nr:hypothetical protein [Cyanobacteriota bacterium]